MPLLLGGAGDRLRASLERPGLGQLRQSLA